MSGMHMYDTWERRAERAAKPYEAKVAKARKMLGRLDRFELEAVAEAAIGMLDDMSDTDEDFCLAGDDGCGPFVNGNGVEWGSVFEGEVEHAHQVADVIDQRQLEGPYHYVQ